MFDFRLIVLKFFSNLRNVMIDRKTCQFKFALLKVMKGSHNPVTSHLNKS